MCVCVERCWDASRSLARHRSGVLPDRLKARMSTSDARESTLRVGGGGGGETSRAPSYGIVRAATRIARYVHKSPNARLVLVVGR